MRAMDGQRHGWSDGVRVQRRPPFAWRMQWRQWGTTLIQTITILIILTHHSREGVVVVVEVASARHNPL